MLTDAEIMAQVFAAFQEEQAEHREAIGELLLELERQPDHSRRKELLDQLFREAHSLKGGARAAGLTEIEQIAHRIEDIFSAVRRNELLLSPAVCDPIYGALDAIGVLTAQAAVGETASRGHYYGLIEALEHVLTTEETPAPALVAEPPEPTIADEAANGERPAGDTLWSEVASTTVRLPTTTLDELMNQTGELMTCTIRARQHSSDLQALGELPARWRAAWRQVQPLISRLRRRTPAIRPTVHHLDDRTGFETLAGHAHSERDLSLLLDTLAQAQTLVTELEGRLAGVARQAGDDYARLAGVTDRLHDQVRRTRMLPLATLFKPLRLHARDIARTAGKQVLLNIDDGGAEADRQVLEHLRDVLTHLIRNAVDHGIEPTELRALRGKPGTGHIDICAAVSGDHMTLTVSDDGVGLDLDAIRRRALNGGMFGPADLERLSEADLADLIFLPGFSTRTTVSEISGRGVGLDIVRSQVERMHGRVSVTFRPGAGTIFTLTVPLSLTSSHGLLLRASGRNYVLPLDAVQRIVPVVSQDIRLLEGRAALVVDGKPLALVALGELLGTKESSSVQRSNLALLLGSGDRQIACMVDAVLGDQELVVHRLPAPLQHVRFVAGATILADGSVVPILDSVDLIRFAIGGQRSYTPVAQTDAPRRQPHILVADDSITTRTLEKNILEAAGYRVQLATDGVEALEILRRMGDNGGCDLLISDVDMPRLNGFELTGALRADSHFQHLPIVLVTSLDTPSDRERGIAAGADAYIVKRSFDQQALLDTIAELI